MSASDFTLTAEGASSLQRAGSPSHVQATQRVEPGVGAGGGVGGVQHELPDLLGHIAVNKSPLKRRFMVPPFSVIDCRCGEWQDRKRAWQRYGIKSEAGRAANLMAQPQRSIEFHEHYKYAQNCKTSAFGVTTSVFDPALAELCYSWFAPVGARVLDPFAGGSVRGIVAAVMGLPYVGIDLRAEQVSANEAQAAALNLSPRWIVGDSTRLGALVEGKFDMVMTCPPYFDLERYSEDPADLSNMSFEAFTAAVYAVALGCSAALRMNRMACVVIQDVRDEQGLMRGIVNTFASAFRDAGMRLYNEAVLLQPLGTACMRAGRFFQQSRKLCKTHGTLLVFVKGQPPKLESEEVWRAAGAGVCLEPPTTEAKENTEITQPTKKESK